ncbi:MAG: hypothetical protein AAF598_17865, partial [Bacteroidota bacterium]
MSWMNRITPRFLTRLDHWLLVNHPFIWRTRIHVVAFWSLIVVNGLILGVTSIVPMSPRFFPTADFIEYAYSISWILLVFAALYWGVTSAKFQFKSTRFSHILGTVSLVFLGFVSLFSNQALLTHQLRLMGNRA